MAKDETNKRSAETRALDVLITEAKDRDPFVASSSKKAAEIDLDWSKIEAKVMAAVNEEAPRLAQRESARMRAMRAGAVVLAAAAAVALYVKSSQTTDNKSANANNANPQVTDTTPASSLVGVTGEVRIGSNVVDAPGFVLHANDSITTKAHGRATFERTRKVAWLAENTGDETSAHVRVKSAGEPLVLGLESGAVEAQVVPVPVGEAFAVDVTSSTGSLVRVAVHGTHLRVARVAGGNRITVDLTEGVVSIGVPPRTGVTYGTLVTAPAHVELDASDLSTIRVDHNLNAVRAAIALNPFGSIEASNNNSPTNAQKLALAPTAAKENNNNSLLPAPRALAPAAPTTKEPEEAPAKAVEPTPAPAPAKAASAPSPGGTQFPQTPARDAIAAAVRDCAVARSRSAARSGNDTTHVTVTSTLKLRVSNSGVVESAQFSPPLPAEIQSCAANVIYKTKLESETGLVSIPIEFEFSR
jgi:hypothetical protein